MPGGQSLIIQFMMMVHHCTWLMRIDNGASKVEC